MMEPPYARRRTHWVEALGESATIALDAIRLTPARSALAITGIVIGIVTVVLVASVLAGVRNQVALLFREFGTDNIFAFHLTGDPYQPPSEREARRLPLEPGFAADLIRRGRDIVDVGVQVIVPTVVNGRALTARAGGRESETILLEGASPNFFDVTGAEFAAGRPFTEVEDRAGARVVVIGANVAKALFGDLPRGGSIGRTLTLAGDVYTVVGEQAPRRGGFFGENRQDNVLSAPQGTVARRFPDVRKTVLYIQAAPGRRDQAFAEAEVILRQLRRLGPGEDNDFNLSTSDQIIAQFDRVSAAIGLVTIALAAVSLFIGGIGIANVMIISVRERTREIGVRLAVGATRAEVRQQFLIESSLLSAAGGALGVLGALALGWFISILAPGLSAVPPAWVVAAGLAASVLTGVVAGYLPARQASGLDPVEALRYE